MAALLLSAAGMLDEHGMGGQAAGEEPAWFWCDVCRVWVRHDWVTHPDEDQHENCARDIQVWLALSKLPSVVSKLQCTPFSHMLTCVHTQARTWGELAW
jgi:hypothetical protein